MLIGASVLAFLVLLVLLAERGGERMWQGTHSALFYCSPCDLRYRRDELVDQGDRVCPRGHYVDPVGGGFSMGTVAIFTCLGFIALAALLTATGAVPIVP
ncbi:MAG TPA: hypothetical protein VGQ42_01140 [Candidatus Dormibacteraeota bacterium]|nr:hypothetical protein [Candidatus Dormibacteraeota bacterium]